MPTKAQVRDILRRRAKLPGVISYSELAALITATKLELTTLRLTTCFRGLMEELQRTPNSGIISALVVHKNPPMEP